MRNNQIYGFVMFSRYDRSNNARGRSFDTDLKTFVFDVFNSLHSIIDKIFYHTHTSSIASYSKVLKYFFQL